MSTSLPAVIEDYFALIDGPAPEQTLRTFAADAHVTDDGHDHRGRGEILAWLTGAASEYETVSTRLSAETTSDAVTVTVRLTGNFPGGVVDLTHTFVLDADGLVRRLTISA